MSKTVVQLLRAPLGGIRKHVLDILEGLPAADFKLILITNVHESDVDLSYLVKNHKIEIHHVDIQEKPGFGDLKNLITIYKILKNRKINVLHGHGAKDGLFARFLAPALKCPCIYTPHGGSLHRVHGTIKNMIYDIAEKILMPLTDIFLFESQYTCNVYSQNIGNPGKKSVINYNGVEIPDSFSSHVYQAGKQINCASFGFLRELKGHDIFIEACRILKEKQIPFQYSIYGNGEFRSKLSDLIVQYKLQNEVKIIEYSKDVLLEMQKYDFVVHPSRFESFGYVPVEAMSVKVPVVVSHEGGLKEVVDEASGFISFSNTPESYVDIFEKIFKGELDVESRVNHGYQRVQALFSKEVMIGNIKRVYLGS